MSMDISNQNKLSEFYEELKRLNIKIIRPDINKCYADFRSDNKNFYYALGGIKNVGFEAVSNIVNERKKNGEFSSINDFIKRVNPKDINKLQLEGLVNLVLLTQLIKIDNPYLTQFQNLFKNQKIFLIIKLLIKLISLTLTE